MLYPIIEAWYLTNFMQKNCNKIDSDKSYLKSSFWRENQNLNFLFARLIFASKSKKVLKR